MKKIKCKVVHSESKTAWNIVGDMQGNKYKLARIPYFVANGDDYEKMNTMNKAEALEHAEFLCSCFNNADRIKF